ncbi:MAG: pitrilysin family protein [Candidatus Sulfopaludibacter sp.]|nr:pitrilysin family protein [Candidatus Sulfopaludibacter sp.]
MKKLWIVPVLVAAHLAAQAPPSAQEASKKKAGPARPAVARVTAAPSYKDLKYPAAKPIPIPPVETVTLPNGIKLFLLEDHELPIVSGSARIGTGNLFDPAGKIGLATMTGMVLRTGGTRKQTGEAIDQALEDVAASVESSIGESSGTVSFTALKESAGPVLAIFHDVITAPEFRQERIDLAKTQLHSAIARRNDDPATIVQREFSDILYGTQNPYGWQMEHDTVDAIARPDLQAFYNRYFFPANVRLALWGDFDAAAMKTRIEKLFADWTVKGEPVPEFPEVNARTSPGTFLAATGGATQTFFAMGQLGGMFNDKDYAALEIMANILGGGAQSRLFQQVRTRMGKAYSINAVWGANYDHPGLLEISGSTGSLSTMETIRAVQKEAQRMRESEVTEEELRVAKETALNSLVFAFDTREKTLSRMLTYDYYGYPMDFIQRYQKALANVTRADVLRVSQAHLDPNMFSLVAVGNPNAFDQPLEVLGRPVTPISLAIKPPTVAPVAVNTLAVEILARAQKAAGGADKLAAAKDFVQTNEFVLAPAAGRLQVKVRTRWIAPDFFRQDSEVPGGGISAYYDGTQGWISTPQGEGPLVDLQLDQVRGTLFRLYFRLLLGDRIPGRTLTTAGSGGIEVGSPAGDSALITFDSSTGLPKTVSYEVKQESGARLQVLETYSDFRDVDGIMIPFKTLVMQGSQEFANVTVTEAKFNSDLQLTDLDQKPAPGVRK